MRPTDLKFIRKMLHRLELGETISPDDLAKMCRLVDTEWFYKQVFDPKKMLLDFSRPRLEER